MPRRQLLSPQARSSLFDPPRDSASIMRFHTLSPEDLALARRRRRPPNRLGFAVQLAYLRHPGRALEPEEVPPEAMLVFIAQQLGIEPAAFRDYARRDTTRREHFLELQAALGLRTFGLADYRSLSSWALEVARQTDRGDTIVAALVDEVRRRRVILPNPSVLERIGLSVRARARAAAHADLVAGLRAEQREGLHGLLAIEEGRARTRFAWLREWPEAPAAANLARIIERLATVRALAIEAAHARRIHRARYALIAGAARAMSAQHLTRLEPARRLAILAAFAIEMEAELTDAAVQMFDRLIGTLFRKAQRQRSAKTLASARVLRAAARAHARSGRALIQARTAAADPFAAIDGILGWDRFVASVEQAEAATAGDHDDDELADAVARYRSARPFAPAFLAALAFRSHRPNDQLLRAVDLLRASHGSSRRPLPSRPPSSFLQRRWRRILTSAGTLDRRAYELAVLAHLRDRLRAGDIWVEGGRTYREFGDFLLPKPAFEALRAEGGLGLAVAPRWLDHLASRAGVLHARLERVAALAASGELPEARLADGRLIVTPIRRATPEAAETLKRRLYAMLPRVRITELLGEVDTWTRFAERFTHLQTGLPAADKPALLGAILADGTNLGLARMAESSKGLTHARLVWTAEWHVREETYTAALATVIDAHHAHPVARLWGPGDTSSSDGQFFRAGGHGEARSEINARYGSDPGVLFYTHVSDRYAPFHTKVIAATAGEAVHVLDGLLSHESQLAIREHYADTAGASDHVFGLCHLLGFRFAPRLRDLADRRLYVLNRDADYGHLEPLIAGPVRTYLIEESWDELLRLAASIKLGAVAPSVMLKKLAAYPRQNGLAKALRELGRIERTLFTLDWLEDPALRRRSHGGLNKGESHHSLKKAVFFNRLGELRDRTFENQSYRASGLNLVAAAVILWNAVYLARAVEALRTRNEIVPDDLLAHVAPLGWEHVGLTGDYSWTDTISGPGQFRPLRDPRSLLLKLVA